MPKLAKEQKNFDFQIKSFDDATGIVTGYLSTFNNIDEGGDRVRPGSFKRTLQSKYQYKKAHNKAYLMPLLWQHDQNTPIGGYVEAKEDTIGLFVECQLDLDVQKGKEAYSALKKGYIFQQSIGYEPIQSEYVKEPDGQMVRDLTEIRLWEGSIVTFPMNDLAVVTGVKSMESMSRQRQTKTLQDHYNEEMAQDLLEDWQDVYVCALTCAIFDAFTIGDSPESDISQALDDFKQLVLSKFVTQGIECGLSEYLESNAYSYTPGLSRMQNGSDDGYSPYGYMSRSTRGMDQKAGRAISAAKQAVISDHVKSVKAMAKKAKADMQGHVDEMHDAVDEMAGNVSGKSLASKAGRALSGPNADKMHDMADKAMTITQEHAKALTKAANNLYNTLGIGDGGDREYGDSDDSDQDEQIRKSVSDALRELKTLAS